MVSRKSEFQSYWSPGVDDRTATKIPSPPTFCVGAHFGGWRLNCLRLFNPTCYSACLYARNTALEQINGSLRSGGLLFNFFFLRFFPGTTTRTSIVFLMFFFRSRFMLHFFFSAPLAKRLGTAPESSWAAPKENEYANEATDGVDMRSARIQRAHNEQSGECKENNNNNERKVAYLRRTPPRSEALRHSGGDRRRWTSPTVTLYLDVDERSDRRPGTEQNTSVGETGPDSNTSDDASFNKQSETQRRKRATTQTTKDEKNA